MSGTPATPSSPTPEPTPTPTTETPAVTPAAPAEAAPSLIAKPAEATPEFVPLTAESIKLAEGFTLADDVRDNFLGIMNDRTLSPAEQAQKLVDLSANMSKASAEAQEKAWADTQTEWQNAVRSDPEIGGDKLEPALGRIAQLAQKYGSSELMEVFALTGAGNNVHMVKFLDKIARDLSEGQPVSGAPATAKPSLASRLFPTMK